MLNSKFTMCKMCLKKSQNRTACVQCIWQSCQFHHHLLILAGLMSVPSLSTLEGVKKYINAMGNSPSAVAPKQTVMLDWASKEDGTHVLTITVGNKVNFSIFCASLNLLTRIWRLDFHRLIKIALKTLVRSTSNPSQLSYNDQYSIISVSSCEILSSRHWE